MVYNCYECLLFETKKTLKWNKFHFQWARKSNYLSTASMTSVSMLGNIVLKSFMAWVNSSWVDGWGPAGRPLIFTDIYQDRWVSKLYIWVSLLLMIYRFRLLFLPHNSVFTVYYFIFLFVELFWKNILSCH